MNNDDLKQPSALKNIDTIDSDNTGPSILRNSKGQFVSIICPNINCDGKIVHEEGSNWRCNGLVYPKRDDQPLEACDVSEFDFQEDPVI